MKNNGILLSFSTINNCLQENNSHNWLNKKVFKLQPEEKKDARGNSYFEMGRNCHRIAQDHVSGVKINPKLAHIKEVFPLVETKQFDQVMKRTVYIEGYEFIFYFDGLNLQDHKSLELKFSGNPWSLGKFRESMQRKIQKLVEPSLTESVIITGGLYPEEWTGDHSNEMLRTNPVKMSLPLIPEEAKEAEEWIVKGIRIFENGDFNGGLDDDGRCALGRQCPWGANCHFKKI